MEEGDECQASSVEGVGKGRIDDCREGNEWKRLEGCAPEGSVGDAALEDLDSLAVGFLWLGEDNFVDAKRGFVKNDLGLGFRGEVDGLGHEEVHHWDDSCVNGCADSECKFEAEVLNNKTGDELTIKF